MTIELSTGLVIGCIIGGISPTIGFIIYVRVELSLLKQTIENINTDKEKEDIKADNKNDEIKTLIRDLSFKMDGHISNTTKQLYDLNTKITRAETLAEANNK